MRISSTAWTLPSATNIAEFTLLNPEYSFYSPQKLQTLKTTFPTKSLAVLTAYRPARLLLHVCIIQTVIRVQYETENAFHQYANTLYARAMLEAKQQICTFLSNRNALLAAFNSANISDEIAHLIPTVVERYNTTPEKLQRECPELGWEYAVDSHLQSMVTDCFFSLVNNIITRHELEGHVKCIRSCAESEVRKTFLIAGGIASGKGCAAWKIKESAESAGIHYADLIKINGDALKPLLLTPGTVPAVFYSQFCVDEATYIKSTIFAALTILLEQNRAYHTFVDETGVKEVTSDYATQKGGLFYVSIVSTDAEKAVERSFSRGKRDGEKGRYEDTYNILNNHKSIASALPFALERISDKTTICVEIWDNNGESHTEMALVASIEMRTKCITIFNPTLLEKFIRKTSINPSAKSPDELYDVHSE